MARATLAALLVAALAGACGGATAHTRDNVAQAACPPDVTLPIPERTCPSARDSGAGKVHGTFPTDGSPAVVIVSVSGAAPVCAGQGPAVTDYWAAENFASQKCVRDMIAAVGGTATDERSWLVDTLGATLTWAQIQLVATHPHVASIEPNLGGPPP